MGVNQFPLQTTKTTNIHRQRTSVLDPSLQNEVSTNPIPTRSSNKDELLHRKDEEEQLRAINDSYCFHHSILGNTLLNPIVLFDPQALPHPINVQALPINSQFSSTLSYERVLAAFSEGEKMQSVPLCLACCSRILRYP